jgi:hypothetical protein
MPRLSLPDGTFCGFVLIWISSVEDGKIILVGKLEFLDKGTHCLLLGAL